MHARSHVGKHEIWTLPIAFSLPRKKETSVCCPVLTCSESSLADFYCTEDDVDEK